MERNPYPQWITVGQGPIILVVGAGGDCLAFQVVLSPPLSGNRSEIN